MAWKVSNSTEIDKGIYNITAQEENKAKESTGYNVSVKWVKASGTEKLKALIEDAVSKIDVKEKAETTELFNLANLDLSACKTLGG